VYEPASKHPRSLCSGGSDLPLFPTNPHYGTLLNHSIARGNKYFLLAQKKISWLSPALDIAVGGPTHYKMLRPGTGLKTSFW
jgi:hypothetical protein